MDIKEKFEAAIERGEIKDVQLTKAIQSILEMDAKIRKNKRGQAVVAAIVELARSTDELPTVIKIITSKVKPVATGRILVSKSVSPIEKPSDKYQDGCVGCDEDNRNPKNPVPKETPKTSLEPSPKETPKPSTTSNLSEAESFKDVLLYFDNSVEQMDEYIQAVIPQSRAKTADGKAKVILKHLNSRDDITEQ